MKKLIVIFAIAAIGYYFYSNANPLDNEIYIDGKTFTFSGKEHFTGVTNYFYTAEGQNVNYATKYVQILEFDKDVAEADRLLNMAPILKRLRLNMTPLDKEKTLYAGNKNSTEITVKAFAAHIKIEQETHLALYVITIDDTQEKEYEFKKHKLAKELSRLIL